MEESRYNEDPIYRRLLGYLAYAAPIESISKYGESNFAIHIKNFLTTVNPVLSRIEHDLIVGKDIDVSELPKTAYSLIAPPGYGKTFFRNIMYSSLYTAYPNALRKGYVNQVTWENDGEKNVRTHDPAGKFTSKELQQANQQFEDALYTSIKTSPITLIEAPVTTAIQLDGIWFGRELGSNALLKLSKKLGKFANLPPVNLLAASFVRGPMLNILIQGRDAFNNAKSLDEAKHVATLFGLAIPATEDEWMNSLNGASLKLVKEIDRNMQALIYMLITTHKINKPTSERIHAKYLEQAQDISSRLELPYDSLANEYNDAANMGEYIKFYFQKFLGIPHANAFIGYNSPDIEDLDIPDIQMLSKFLASQA